MKTIALQEKTFEILGEMKKREKAQSFNELILTMIKNIKNTSDSMFGSLKGKTKSFSTKERHNIWGE